MSDEVYSEIAATPDEKRKGQRIATAVTMLAALYVCIFPAGGYDLSLQLFAAISVWPLVSTIYLFWRTKEIAIGIFFVTLFQTWNMFLHPYLADMQFSATYRTVNPAYLGQMGFFSMLSVFTLYAGFMYGYFKFPHKPFWKASSMSYESVNKTMWWVLGIGIGSSTLQVILGMIGISISFLGSIDMMIPTVIASLLVMYILRGGRNGIIIVLASLYIAYSFVYVVGGTLFIYVILLAMGPLTVYITERKRIPYTFILLGVILIIPIYNSRHEHRNVGLYSSGAAKFDLGMKILEENYSEISLDAFIKSSQNDNPENDPYKDDRFEGVTYMGQIVHCHEDLGYSYQYGKTFAWLPTMFVPRIFLPFRPGQNMGDEWAEYYGVKDPSWRCSINFPMLVEFYCNFGWIGMVLLSWLNGFAIVWVMGKFDFGHGDANLLLLLFIALKLIVVEANITLNYGLIIQVLFICWLVKKYQLRNYA